MMKIEFVKEPPKLTINSGCRIIRLLEYILKEAVRND